MTIKHHGVDTAAVHDSTRAGRYAQMLWGTVTQVWSWEDGDAIVSVVGTLIRPCCQVVLRLGTAVHVVEGETASLCSALAAYGRNPATGRPS